MSNERSLRRLLVTGATAFAFVAGVGVLSVVVLFASLRRNYERDMRTAIDEQRAADEVVTAVYGQLVESYQQIQSPSRDNLARFDSLGQTAYTRLRDYLFRPMSLDARLQVERIKELHQALEVDAHRAFDLIERGDAAAARARIAEMDLGTKRLRQEMDGFVVLLDRERTARHQAQVVLLQRWMVALFVAALLLIVYAAVFVRVLRRRVVVPLDQLSAGAVRLGTGDLTARIPPQRHEEFAVVARSFNEMAASIESARTEVVRRNTELAEALRSLKEAQQELVQQEKLSAIGMMLAGLAHELNNPLAGVIGAAQCLEEELAEHSDPAVQEAVKELVSPLVADALRARDLVRNLLQFSRKASAQLETVHLKTAIGVATGLRSHEFAQAGKALVVDIPESLHVTVDPQALEHAAINVVNNALDALVTGNGTRLMIRAESSGAEWVTLSFEDDGLGFTEPARVFDAFYTTKPVGTGTGLGLSLVHRFVESVGGTICATNVSPHGARIAIKLRAATVAPTASAPATQLVQPSQDATTSARRRVLVVDDERSIREIQRRIIEKMGAHVMVAQSGVEAIQTLERERVDAVITDIRMPGDVDGIALYQWIERTRPELTDRCLFVTGMITEGAATSIMTAHPERILTKPFDNKEYTARVQAVLDRASDARKGFPPVR